MPKFIILEGILAKKRDLKQRKFKKAALQMGKLYNDLKTEIKAYQINLDRDEFLRKKNEAFAAAREVLDLHRGWTKLVFNAFFSVVFSILSLGIANLIAGKWWLFSIETESSSILTDLDQALNEAILTNDFPIIPGSEVNTVPIQLKSLEESVSEPVPVLPLADIDSKPVAKIPEAVSSAVINSKPVTKIHEVVSSVVIDPKPVAKIPEVVSSAVIDSKPVTKIPEVVSSAVIGSKPVAKIPEIVSTAVVVSKPVAKIPLVVSSAVIGSKSIAKIPEVVSSVIVDLKPVVIEPPELVLAKEFEEPIVIERPEPVVAKEFEDPIVIERPEPVVVQEFEEPIIERPEPVVLQELEDPIVIKRPEPVSVQEFEKPILIEQSESVSVERFEEIGEIPPAQLPPREIITIDEIEPIEALPGDFPRISRVSFNRSQISSSNNIDLLLPVELTPRDIPLVDDEFGVVVIKHSVQTLVEEFKEPVVIEGSVKTSFQGLAQEFEVLDEIEELFQPESPLLAPSWQKISQPLGMVEALSPSIQTPGEMVEPLHPESSLFTPSEEKASPPMGMIDALSTPIQSLKIPAEELPQVLVPSRSIYALDWNTVERFGDKIFQALALSEIAFSDDPLIDKVESLSHEAIQFLPSDEKQSVSVPYNAQGYPNVSLRQVLKGINQAARFARQLDNAYTLLQLGSYAKELSIIPLSKAPLIGEAEAGFHELIQYGVQQSAVYVMNPAQAAFNNWTGGAQSQKLAVIRVAFNELSPPLAPYVMNPVIAVFNNLTKGASCIEGVGSAIQCFYVNNQLYDKKIQITASLHGFNQRNNLNNATLVVEPVRFLYNAGQCILNGIGAKTSWQHKSLGQLVTITQLYGYTKCSIACNFLQYIPKIDAAIKGVTSLANLGAAIYAAHGLSKAGLGSLLNQTIENVVLSIPDLLPQSEPWSGEDFGYRAMAFGAYKQTLKEHSNKITTEIIDSFGNIAKDSTHCLIAGAGPALAALMLQVNYGLPDIPVTCPNPTPNVFTPYSNYNDPLIYGYKDPLKDGNFSCLDKVMQDLGWWFALSAGSKVVAPLLGGVAKGNVKFWLNVYKKLIQQEVEKRLTTITENFMFNPEEIHQLRQPDGIKLINSGIAERDKILANCKRAQRGLRTIGRVGEAGFNYFTPGLLGMVGETVSNYMAQSKDCVASYMHRMFKEEEKHCPLKMAGPEVKQAKKLCVQVKGVVGGGVGIANKGLELAGEAMGYGPLWVTNFLFFTCPKNSVQKIGELVAFPVSSSDLGL